MATSRVSVTEGTGKNLATHSITEDAMTKEVSRANLNDVAGNDVMGATTDARATQTDTTSVKLIPIWKQISFSIQALVTAFGAALTRGSGAADSNTQRVTIDTGQLAQNRTAAGAMSDGFQLLDIPTDGTAAQRPIAVAHGANPSAVAAGAKVVRAANRHGIPFAIGGHPNIISRAHRILASDGAQTDAELVSVSAGAKIIVTQIWVKAAKANSGNVAVKIGFGTANVPTPALAGVNGLIFDEVVGAGEGHQIGNGAGIVAVGADAEDLRLTCDSPTAGNLTVGYSYYTIES